MNWKLLWLIFSIFLFSSFFYYDFLNKNAGLVSFWGLFIILPLTLIADQLITENKNKNNCQQLKRILIRELWANMVCVSQVEESHRGNLEQQNLHIPNFGPRTYVIERFFDFNVITGLNEIEKDRLIEIFGQLKTLQIEFKEWRKLLLRGTITQNKELYQILSQSVTAVIEPVMRNMIDLWIPIIKEIGSESTDLKIKKLNEIIIKKTNEGKWLRGSYKASFFNKDGFKNMSKFDVILCWKNDFPDSTKEVIEIRKLIDS